MEILTFTIAAGETKRFERAGRQLEVIAAAASINIDFYDASGSQNEEMRGALAGFYSLEPFSGFDVQNPATVAQVVTLMIASGQGGSRRAPGVVEVVDAGRSRVIQHLEFISSAAVGPALGTHFTAVSLFNNTNLGVQVDSLAVRTDIAQAIQIGFETVELVQTAGQFDVLSKRCNTGAAVSIVGVRTNRRSDLAASPPAAIALQSNLSASVTTPIALGRAPFVLAPGTGLRVACTVVNAGLTIEVNGGTFPWIG